MLGSILSYVSLAAVSLMPLQNVTPTVTHVAPPQRVPAPWVQQLDDKPLPQLSEALFKPLPTLSLASFHYDPEGTHPNGYDPGQCTWGAASMKGNIPDNWGNANQWPDAARAAGYQVSDQPIVGAVAVEYIGYYGHVAVVTGVNPDGSVTVEEMNYDGLGDGLYRSSTWPASTWVYIYI